MKLCGKNLFPALCAIVSRLGFFSPSVVAEAARRNATKTTTHLAATDDDNSLIICITVPEICITHPMRKTS